MLGHGRDQIVGGLLVEEFVDRDEADALQVDPARPLLAHRGEHRPRNAVLGRARVEVRADQRRAAGVGRAQGEIHARRDVLSVPPPFAVFGDRVEGAGKVPSGFGRRGQMWPLSRWVCMSTNPGQTMPRSMSNFGAVVRRPGLSMRSTRPSFTVMSAVINPSPSASP